MKKILLFAVVAVAVTSTSCRKDLTCTCTYEQTDATTVGSTTTTQASSGKTTSSYTSVKKKNVNLYDNCENRTEVYTTKSGSGNSAYTNVETTVYTCELK